MIIQLLQVASKTVSNCWKFEKVAGGNLDYRMFLDTFNSQIFQDREKNVHKYYLPLLEYMKPSVTMNNPITNRKTNVVYFCQLLREPMVSF